VAWALDIKAIYYKIHKLKSHKVGFKVNQTVTTEKAYPKPCRWQPKVRHKAGNGGKASRCPRSLQEGYGLLSPNIPGMQISGHNALNTGGVQDLSA
jgi:hypothetical protein